jgi:hypothetical protein
MKAIAKDRSRRYTSAGDLAADVDRFLANKPVEARPPSRAYLLRKFARRNRTAVMMGTLALAALVAIASISTVFSFLLDGSLREANRRAAAYNFERGLAALERAEIGPGLLWMVESWRSAVAARDPAWQHTARGALSAWQRAIPRPRFVFSHAGDVERVGFSPDGRTAFSAGHDRTVRLWNTATGEAVGAPLVHRLNPSLVAFTRDGTKVVTGDEAGIVQSWDASTGKPDGPPLVHFSPVRALAVSPDGETVLTGSGTFPLDRRDDQRKRRRLLADRDRGMCRV